MCRVELGKPDRWVNLIRTLGMAKQGVLLIVSPFSNWNRKGKVEKIDQVYPTRPRPD